LLNYEEALSRIDSFTDKSNLYSSNIEKTRPFSSEISLGICKQPKTVIKLASNLEIRQ